MGDVLEGAKEHILDSAEAIGYNPYYMDGFKDAFESLLANDKLKNLPLKFIGEVQYLTENTLR